MTEAVIMKSIILRFTADITSSTRFGTKWRRVN